MNRLIFTILLTFCSLHIFAQNDLKIGQWKSYLSYRYARCVTQSKENVYYSTENAVLSIDKTNDEIDVLTKVDGLTDAGVQLVKYNDFANTLLVAYENGNIDLVRKEGSTLNVRDILDNTNIIGDKKIYDVFIESATNAYLACGFGIVKFNMKTGEFDFTTFTTSPVKNIEILDGFIYANINGKLYKAPNNPNINLADFKNWKSLGKNEGLSDSYVCRGLCSARGKLYLGVNDTLCSWQNNNLKKILGSTSTEHTVNEISAEGKNVVVTFTFRDNRKYDARMIALDANDNFLPFFNNNCFQYVYNSIEDEKGQIWISDISDDNKVNGFKRIKSINEQTCKVVNYNSPYANTISEIAIADDNSLWIAAGTVANGKYQYNFNGFYRYVNGKWINKNKGNEPLLDTGYYDKVRDLHTIALDKKTKKAFIGSFWAGLLEVDETGKILKHYKDSSQIYRAIGDPASARVGGLAFDKKGNLWIANNLGKESVAVLGADQKWYHLGAKMGAQFIFQCAIEPINSYKWFAVSGGGGGIVVFDEGKDLADESDDRYAIINTSNSNLPSNIVNCVEIDLDGRVWAGTDNGAVYFSCGSSLFTNPGSCKGLSPKTVVDGIPELLLKYNNVNTIGVDGANRKWFGTTNGIFVQSADGREQVAYFNVDNSPLFDNNIIDIACNNRTGEVYIATDKGLQSVKTDALAGGKVQGLVTIYPNPVRPDYEGSVAIKGLAENSKMKITDLNGRLVYETDALGGQAIWDGKDYNGRKAETGVYYIFAAYTEDIDYPSEAVAKVLIVK